MIAMQEEQTAELQATWRRRYNADLGEISRSTRDVLENYSKIPPDEVMPHVYRVREEAFSIFPYPCIGQGRFLQLAIGTHKLYPEVLHRMRGGEEIFLDLGCAFGQDLRRLVADGVDSKQCYGSDLRLDFLDLGYKLFRDKESLQSEFIAADIFDSESPLKYLYGKVDIINASSFFHLFGRDGQIEVARRCVKLLKPQKDSLIVGRQRSSLQPFARVSSDGKTTRYWHSPESWHTLWTEVGDEAGARFEVQTRFLTESFEELTVPAQAEGEVSISFSVRRLP